MGMDLVRLALERAASAEEACAVIVELLEKHGQGGRCGHENPKFSYHNSFIVADPSGAFVLETAGRLSAVETVRGSRSISNGLTIPEFRDRHSDFLYTKFSGSAKRRERTGELCRNCGSVGELMAVLRDHHGASQPVYHFVNGGLNAPCVHAGGAITSSQSTASWVCELQADRRAHWVTATSAPCTGIFKPVHVERPVDYGAHARDVADDSLWWRHEAIHRAIMRNPLELAPHFMPERDELEQRWLATPPDSETAFGQAGELLDRWLEKLRTLSAQDVRPPWTRKYWNQRNRTANLSPVEV